MSRLRAAARIVIGASVACVAACGPRDPRAALSDKNIAYSPDAFVAEARAGHADSVKWFLDAGMDPNARDANGVTALAAAASNGNTDIARQLIAKGVDLKAERPVPQLPLMLAIRAHRSDLAVLLLDSGAHAYVQDDQWAPLMLASFLGDTRTVEALLRHKPDVNAKNDRGMTALLFAASGGHAPIARALLDNGAAIDAQDGGGHTALMLAANNGHADVVKLLLHRHADSKKANRAGATAASLAAGNGEQEILSLLGRPAATAASQSSTSTPSTSPAASSADEQTYDEAAKAAWRYIERNYRPATGLIDATAGYPYTTVWDIGSGIGALYAGHELALIDDAEYDRRIRRLLETLSTIDLYDRAAFNKVYATSTGKMIARGNRPSERGYGWSAIDLGRLLVWLKVLAVNQPAYANDAAKVVARLAMPRLVEGGYLRGEDLDHGGAPRTYQEGRVGYEQYAARGFAAWNTKPDKALRLDENSITMTIMGQQLPADIRGGDRITSDPLILMGLELGWDPPMDAFATAFLAAQQTRYQQTGKVTLLAEDAIGRPPYFFYYYCAFANAKSFGIDVQDPRGVVEQPRWVSSKAAFAWHTLRPSAYTAQALRLVQAARTPAGWGSGIYEGSGTPTGTLNVNTAAVILEAALVHARGGPILKTTGSH